VHVVEGRLFAPAAAELIVGRRVRDRFGLGLGSKLTIRKAAWRIVGVFARTQWLRERDLGDLDTLGGPLRKTQSYQALVLRLPIPDPCRSSGTR